MSECVLTNPVIPQHRIKMPFESQSNFLHRCAEALRLLLSASRSGTWQAMRLPASGAGGHQPGHDIWVTVESISLCFVLCLVLVTLIFRGTRLCRDISAKGDAGRAAFVLTVAGLTAWRVTMNVRTVLNVDSIGRKVFYGNLLPAYAQLADAGLRPAVGALSLLPLFSSARKSLLQVVALAGCMFVFFLSAGALEFNAFAPKDEELTHYSTALNGGSLVPACWLNRAFLTVLTRFKLERLGWRLTGSGACAGWILWVFLRTHRNLARAPKNLHTGLTGRLLSEYAEAYSTVGGFLLTPMGTLLFWALLGVVTAVNASVLLYEAVMKKKLLQEKGISIKEEAEDIEKLKTKNAEDLTDAEKTKIDMEAAREAARKKDAELRQQASWSVNMLFFGAAVTIADVIYMATLEQFATEIGQRMPPAVFLTVDNMLVLTSLLVIGGLLGETNALEELEVLKEMQHMGRSHGQRIAFPGKVNPKSKHCIVSFPGKYAPETWTLGWRCKG